MYNYMRLAFVAPMILVLDSTDLKEALTPQGLTTQIHMCERVKNNEKHY